MRSQKAQLESEERGLEEVSAADLLWLLPSSARLKLSHIKHGALEAPLLILCRLTFWTHTTWP